MKSQDSKDRGVTGPEKEIKTHEKKEYYHISKKSSQSAGKVTKKPGILLPVNIEVKRSNCKKTIIKLLKHHHTNEQNNEISKSEVKKKKVCRCTHRNVPVEEWGYLSFLYKNST